MSFTNRKAKRYAIRPKFKSLAVWFITLLLATLYIVVGFRIFSQDLRVFDIEGAFVEKARVLSIGETQVEEYELHEAFTYENYATEVEVVFLTGSLKGQTTTAIQTGDNYTDVHEVPVKPGDKVILYNYADDGSGMEWIIGEYARFDKLLILGILFFALLLVFGGFKGLNTLISLTYTVLAVFVVFIPSILNGYNIYLMTTVTCVFTIIMTLLLTNGATPKSFATIMGCFFGVVVAGALSLFYENSLQLTGLLDEHSIYLTYLDSGVSIDLVALIFAMTVIGAMGAVMDVAMDIASSLYEIRIHAPDIRFSQLVASGMRIGRDVMGTMANTLVLAYIGSSLCSILLLITYSASLRELLNRESIVVEILQALVGSMAILLTIPLTAVICGIFYTRHHFKEEKENRRVLMEEDLQ